MARLPAPRPWLLGLTLGLTLVVLAWAAALGGSVWLALERPEQAALAQLLQPLAGFAFLFALLLPMLLAALFAPWVRAWPRAAERLHDEVAIVRGPNPRHRIGMNWTSGLGGAAEMRRLALAVDGLAQAHAALHGEVEARIAESNARAAEETRRLAALMSELPQAVLVCNREGRILLFNGRASELLGASGPVAGDVALGIGRPLGGLIDAGVLAHAWQQVERRMARGQARPAAHFVTTLRSDADQALAGSRLLRAMMVPVDADAAAAGGYVLIVDDITRSVEEQSRRDALLLRLTEGTRAALGNLRAAAQALQQYPAMDAERRARFIGAVHEEAERLAAQSEQALRDPGSAVAGAWPLEDMQVADLAVALQRSLRSGPGIECGFDGAGGACWLAVDSHGIVQMLSHLVTRLAAEVELSGLTLRVRDGERFVRLELGWSGAPLEPARLAHWEATARVPVTQRAAVPLRELLDRHGAEIWTLAGSAAAGPALCLQLPAARGSGGAPAARGRPIAYDFDLFNQPGQTEGLDETPLAAASYTVFDTETTGLRPSEGDEIIAIGAVRIVNQHLLEAESFECLTRPRRPVRASALAVHGIDNERLQDEPPLEAVLPSFARFCEGTVLVAHNAAFDMRFLELARERTGVRFDQPVLDTLLLASIVQPGHRGDELHLEQIAARLGIEVVGRHQALGDAIVAARVFLALLPLLAERGIFTLGQARAASLRSAEAGERF